MAAFSVVARPVKWAWSTFWRHLWERKWIRQTYQLSAVILVTWVTLFFMCAYISFPVYLSTDSGSLDENLPPLLNTDGDSLLLLPNNKSKSKPSRIRLTFGSRTTGNLTGVLSRLCPLYPHTLREFFNCKTKKAFK